MTILLNTCLLYAYSEQAYERLFPDMQWCMGSNNLLHVEEGSLHPTLQKLLKAKLVKTEWDV